MISSLIKNLISFKSDALEEHGDENPALLFEDTHPITEKAAGLYEKFRNALDYSEGNQMQRRAIERLLRRHIIFESDKGIGSNLLKELIVAGYISESKVTVRHAQGIDLIVKKYTLLKEFAGSSANGSFKAWTRTMAAIEIYRMLFPNTFDIKVLDTWTQILKSSIVVHESISEKRYLRSLQFAARRALLEQSDPELCYSALEDTFPAWSSISNDNVNQEVERLSLDIEKFSRKVDDHIKDPLVWHITKRIKNSRIAISVVKELIERFGWNLEDILKEEGRLSLEINNILEPKYKKILKSIKANGRRALIYIFLTKILIALLIEVPLDVYILGHIDYFPLSVNIIFPPLLLWLIVTWRFNLGKGNTSRIYSSVKAMIEGNNKRIFIPMSSGQRDVSFGAVAFNGFFYTITFGLIIGILVALGFSVASIVIFLMFIALICYFGNRVRGSASRWQNNDYRKDALSLFGTLLLFPIVRLGRWLSESFSSINFVVFFMDMIIETPFRLLLSEFNTFMNFVKDKAEDAL